MTPLTERLEKLKEIAGKANPGPRGYDSSDGDICSGCRSMVDVRGGCDWDDGNICDQCVRDYYDGIPPRTALALISALEIAVEALKDAERTLDRARYSELPAKDRCRTALARISEALDEER